MTVQDTVSQEPSVIGPGKTPPQMRRRCTLPPGSGVDRHLSGGSQHKISSHRSWTLDTPVGIADSE